MAKKVSKQAALKAAHAIGPALGFWSTTWWGLSCGYALLVVALVFFPLSVAMNVMILGSALIVLFLGWIYLYGWWRRDLKRAKVDMHDAWHDLFTVRKW